MRHVHVLVIGAGPGGICAGVRLRQHGIDDFLIVDRADGFGGTWRRNVYPGAACDIKSHVYSFSFRPKTDWTRPWAGQAEILEYLEDCAHAYALAEKAQFGVGVTDASWREDTDTWRVVLDDGSTVIADHVISAIGLFGVPRIPDIAGADRFEGAQFHSAHWPDDLDPGSSRIGIVGSAASAVQIVAALSGRAAHLLVFQRTAQWILPKPNDAYGREDSAAMRGDVAGALARRRAAFDEVETSLKFDEAIEAQSERRAVGNMAAVEEDELRSKLHPTISFGAQRRLFASDYYPAFNREDVELVTSPIDRFVPSGLVTADGETHALDAVVYATGYETALFTAAVRVIGREGENLGERWAAGATAFLGIAVDRFPNFFILYGPNTNAGSILFMLETQVDHVVNAIAEADARSARRIEVTRTALERWDVDVQQQLSEHPKWSVDEGGYYRSASGRVVTQWPSSMQAYAAVVRAERGMESYELR